MVYKRFRTQVTARILLLGISLVLLFYLIFRTQLFAALLITAVLILYQVYALIRYTETTNRDLSRFFQSIKYADFSQTFKDDGRGSTFSELRNAFNDVCDAFRKARSEKEEHYHYLQTVVQHIGVGLIAFQKNGDVELINTAAKRLLNVPRLKNLKFLEPFSKPLVDRFLQLGPKERALVKVEDKGESLHLALYATEFKLGGQAISLVSIQNIHSELEKTEIEAWQKLIRVLTHEIMNSITPISSLASTMKELLIENFPAAQTLNESEKETLDDMRQAVSTIQKRSQGLLHFVDAYRNLTLIPKPSFQIFPVQELFDRVEKLMQANIKDKRIDFAAGVEPNTLELTADPELIEQVLINLLLNALQALENQDDAKILLRAHLDDRGRIIMQISDNGPGISGDNLEKIFIPFFSTKAGGSGIGLSLSRQIMGLHNGSINVYSKPGTQTTFTLRF
ncbi:MAG: ATP-binding protein [Candidatus Aminicenantes bacterium]|nr:ATP-binding protein [Candidatus Aminicenantes bacterium]